MLLSSFSTPPNRPLFSIPRLHRHNPLLLGCEVGHHGNMKDLASRAQQLAARIQNVGGTLTPATEQQLAAAEQALGRPLPAELAALFRITNGVAGVVFDGGYRLLSLDGLLASWQLSLELAKTDSGCQGIDGARDAYFLPDWFPILDGGDSTFLAYDNQPASEGRVGQLVIVDPEDEYREVRSAVMWDWLLTESIEFIDEATDEATDE